MFNTIRAATKEEVERIADTSDLGPGCVVVALDTPKGAILAVIRTLKELDPVHYPEGIDTRMKTVFLRDTAHLMLGMGAPSYYFNLPADDETYQAAAKHWGCEQVSTSPVLRFKKDLIHNAHNEQNSVQ